jgi:hypothetical protein
VTDPHQHGDRSTAICEHCRKRVATRFEVRPFAMPDVIIPDLLVAVYLECGETASIPPESSERIALERRRPGIDAHARTDDHHDREQDDPDDARHGNPSGQSACPSGPRRPAHVPSGISRIGPNNAP